MARTAKLTEAAVQAIRREHRTGTCLISALAQRYGVDRKTIYDAGNRATWTRVPDLPMSPKPTVGAEERTAERPTGYVVVLGNGSRQLWVE